MCDECRNATEEEKDARSVRVVSAAEAIRAALYGSPGNLPSHAPETVGELAEAVAGFVYSVDAIAGGGLIRSVLDKLLDAQEMRAGESDGGLGALIEMLRTGRAGTAGPMSLAMNTNSGGIPTGDRKSDGTLDAPGMYL